MDNTISIIAFANENSPITFTSPPPSIVLILSMTTFLKQGKDVEDIVTTNVKRKTILVILMLSIIELKSTQAYKTKKNPKSCKNMT